MARVVLVAGTYGQTGAAPTADDWFCPDSAFSAFLIGNGHRHARPERCFTWTTDLDGVPQWRPWRPVVTGYQWAAGGYALLDYCELEDARIALDDFGRRLVFVPDLWLITHSHGLQVAANAIRLGLRPGGLIDVCGPVRGDLMPAYEVIARTTNWRHIHSDRSDYIQVLGGLFDGRFTLFRTDVSREVQLPYVLNTAWPGVGHTKLLNDPERFAIWREQKWLDDLRLPPRSLPRDRPRAIVDDHDY